MQICIPHQGQRLRLTKNWTFTLAPSYRNESLIKLIEPAIGNAYSFQQRPVTLPAGMLLSVARLDGMLALFGLRDLSPWGKGFRFRVSYDDANKIECEPFGMKCSCGGDWKYKKGANGLVCTQCATIIEAPTPI